MKVSTAGDRRGDGAGTVVDVRPWKFTAVISYRPVAETPRGETLTNIKDPVGRLIYHSSALGLTEHGTRGTAGEGTTGNVTGTVGVSEWTSTRSHGRLGAVITNTGPGIVASTGRSDSLPVNRLALDTQTRDPSGGSGATPTVVGTGTEKWAPEGTCATTARPREELRRIVMLNVYFLVFVLLGLFRLDRCYLVADNLLPRDGTRLNTGKRMGICTETRLSRTGILISRALIAELNVNCSATYRDADGLACRRLLTVKDLSSGRKTLVINTDLKRRNAVRLAVVINRLLRRSICKMPVNVCIRQARGSKRRRTAIIRMVKFLRLFGRCGLSIN